MNGQMPIVLLLVLAAVLYLGRRTWRTWNGQGYGCGKGCCSGHTEKPPAVLIPSEQLTLRIRDARRPAEPSS